jgi:hypothetical protein
MRTDPPLSAGRPEPLSRGRKPSAFLCGMLMMVSVPLSAATVQLPAELDELKLQQIQQDFLKAHEKPPLGVPREYSWARYPRTERGNAPSTFLAATGWGQVFHTAEIQDASRPIQIQNFHVLLCSGPERRWLLVQKGGLAGAQFRADYKNNDNRAPSQFRQEGEITSISFEKGSAYHFWPSQGRFDLPGGDICGWLVVLQARVAGPAAAESGYLVGLGADYWLNRTAPWDNYRTNLGVAVGRLRQVGSDWQWYGLSTATDADLTRLRKTGYEVGVDRRPPR